MFDTHCHLTHPRFHDDLDAVVEGARTAGLVGCVTIGTGTEDACRGLEIARRFTGLVHCAAGIDPFTSHCIGDGFDAELARLEEMLRDGSFRALGEVGLDYHYDLDPRPVQARRFELQVELAGRLGLPLVLHVRDAHDDMLAILGAHPRARGIVHSFSGGPELAGRYLDLGWHLAFNGVATYRSGAEVLAAARVVPAGRLLLETDAPYLAPQARRGTRCEPAHVAITLRVIAAARGETEAEVRETTTRNAQALLGLPVSP
jgi:TatD DNase family protein